MGIVAVGAAHDDPGAEPASFNGTGSAPTSVSHEGSSDTWQAVQTALFSEGCTGWMSWCTSLARLDGATALPPAWHDEHG